MKETIYGQVVSKANSYQVGDAAGRKHLIKSEELRAYERSFIKQCSVYKGMLISRPFKLLIDVFESSNRYDLDNALKTVLDCLQYTKAITNDSLCHGIQATKHIDQRRPRIEFEIIELEPRLL